MKEKLVITGCSGRIGKILTEGLKDQYEIYGINRKESSKEKQFTVDISNLENFKKVLREISPFLFLVHLAADPNIEASWDSVLKNNIIGTRNVYECAREFKVRRIIFASSNRVTGAYEGIPPRLHLETNPKLISVSDPTRPDSYYGISKAFGEVLARQFYDLYSIESICLRIGTVTEEDDPRVEERMMKTWLSHRDLIQLVEKSLRSNVEFGIYYGVSNNTGRFWDISNAIEELGYHPRDNAASASK